MSSTASCSPTRCDHAGRAREDTRGRHFNPAWPTHTPTSTLRISHFPDPPHPSLEPPSAPRLDTEGCHERAFTVNLDGELADSNIRLILGSSSTTALSGHTPQRPRSAAYTATKHAITGLTKSISLDGRKFDISCGQIDIGNAATTMTERMADGVRQVDGTVRPEPRVDVGDVPRAVLYLASLPLEANVATMTVMATQMPFIGRG
jgi:hypothetical protein